MSDTAYSLIRKEIRKQMNDYADTLISGVNNFEEYKRLTGVIEGLAIIERYVIDLESASEDG